MDINQNTSIELYYDCGELPQYNWSKLKQTGDLLWLVKGYEGSRSGQWDISLGNHLKTVLWGIEDEYAKLCKNNVSDNYYELIADISDAQKRINFVSMLLFQLGSRPRMKPEIKKMYIEELRGWRFLLNKGKPFEDELKRLDRQLKHAIMKRNQLIKDKKRIDKQFGASKTPSEKIKVRIENKIGRHIDWKKTTVKEWVYIIEDATKKAA